MRRTARPGPRLGVVHTRARAGWVVALCVAFASATGACASVLGIESGILEDAGPDATTDARADASVDASPGKEAGPSMDSAFPDVNPFTDACVATTIAANAVYVSPSPSGQDGSNCGSTQTPCATITHALLSGATTIYLAAGTYNESITLPANVTVVGGFTSHGQKTWTHDCQSVSVIQGTSNVAVSVTAAGAASTLRTLIVQSASAVDAGESMFGIMATGAGTNLVLDGVEVETAPGGAGAAGAMGTMGGSGGSGCGADSGAPGTAVGGPGSPGGGVFTSAGYQCMPGTKGANGGVGNNGAPSTPPFSCVGCFGCSATLCTGPTSSCGTAGSSGCGGLGGGGGTPGGCGGSSVALFAWDATVSIKGRLNARGGGNGGIGGPGGAGGGGGMGSSGVDTQPCQTGCGALCATTSTGHGTGGGPGGMGGTGAPGGVGGGGPGGSSYAVYQGGAAQVATNVDAGTVLLAGSAGSGTGGAPNGASKFIGP